MIIIQNKRDSNNSKADAFDIFVQEFLKPEEHPADFNLVDEASKDITNLALFELIKIWATERTLASITGHTHGFEITTMNEMNVEYRLDNRLVNIQMKSESIHITKRLLTD